RGADLADVLGVTGNQAQALAPRARSRLEKSREAMPVVVSELQHCPELGAVLAGQGGERARLLRRRVKRHIRRCEICAGPLRIHRPAVLPGLLPAALPPGYLRQRTLDAATGESQSAVAYRADVIKRAPRFGANGFPLQLTTSAGPGWRGISVKAVADDRTDGIRQLCAGARGWLSRRVAAVLARVSAQPVCAYGECHRALALRHASSGDGLTQPFGLIGVC